MTKAVVLAVLMAADVATTALILAGGGVELNPIAAPLVAAYGVPGMVIVKVLVFTAFVMSTRYVVEAFRPLVWGLALGISTIPVVSNGLLLGAMS